MEPKQKHEYQITVFEKVVKGQPKKVRASTVIFATDRTDAVAYAARQYRTSAHFINARRVKREATK